MNASSGPPAGAPAGGFALLHRLGRCRATPEEERGELDGDELLAAPTVVLTHAITIDAPAAAVWPWLVQMGWGRAGWYTSRRVDRLLMAGSGPSADRIVPALQRLRVGDSIPGGPPGADRWFAVERLQEERLLVLRSTTRLPRSRRPRKWLLMNEVRSWHLREPALDRTRLVRRDRIRLPATWPAYALVPLSVVTARSHLRGLRALASRDYFEAVAT
jgi:hypothetical protein